MLGEPRTLVEGDDGLPQRAVVDQQFAWRPWCLTGAVDRRGDRIGQVTMGNLLESVGGPR